MSSPNYPLKKNGRHAFTHAAQQEVPAGLSSPCASKPKRFSPDEESNDSLQKIPDFDKQKAFKRKIDKVLSNRATFFKSAEASFKQFDLDGNEKLDFDEIQKLMLQLIENMQLPPLDVNLLRNIFNRYDKEHDNAINLREFQELYWELLHAVKEKFYPTRNLKVHRRSFVQERNLLGTQDIQTLLTFDKLLGAGAFGEVFLVRDKSSGLQRVCKIINKDRSKIPIEQIEAEIEVLKNLDHPNIIKIFDVYSDHHSMYIIMEYCDGGELAQRLMEAVEKGQRMTEQYVANIMRQLLEAVNYFHSFCIAHKDLKPENILYQTKLVESPIKIIDFGLAEMFDRRVGFSRLAAGTYLYIAPEVLDFVVTLKCDIWSCGCIMFFLFTGEVPFPGATVSEVEYKLRNCEPPYSKLNGLPISAAAVDLMKHMLRRDFNARYSAQQCLTHPWLNSHRHSDMELPKEICSNLKRYRRQSSLKNVLSNMLAHQLNVSGNQVRQIVDVFKMLDADGNGVLSKVELAGGLQRANVPSHEITQIINALDVDASDSVSYTEFLSACYTYRESELNLVWAIFCKIDRDGDGKITIDEFIECLTQTSKQLGANRKSRMARDEQELRKMVADIDRNGDGVIDWHEFKEYMTG